MATVICIYHLKHFFQSCNFLFRQILSNDLQRMIKDEQVLNRTKPNVRNANTETKHMHKETSQAGEERNNKNRKVKESTMKNQDAAFLKTSKKECKLELRVHKSITDSLTWGRSWTNFPKINKYARHTYTQRHLYEEDFFMFQYITEIFSVIHGGSMDGSGAVIYHLLCEDYIILFCGAETPRYYCVRPWSQFE